VLFLDAWTRLEDAWSFCRCREERFHLPPDEPGAMMRHHSPGLHTRTTPHHLEFRDRHPAFERVKESHFCVWGLKSLSLAGTVKAVRVAKGRRAMIL
jgi:hypothetical protein